MTGRLPSLRDVALDYQDRRLSDVLDLIPGPLPAVIDHARTPTPFPGTMTSADLLDGLGLDRTYQHSTTLGGFDPNVMEWLDGHRVPVSPAGTVLLLKGVDRYYRSPNGANYSPGCRVIDPDWGRRDGAGLYLCATRDDVHTFVARHLPVYRLMIVEAAVSALGLYTRDRRKIVAREVHVHREIPR